MALFLGSLFSSIDLGVYLCINTAQSVYRTYTVRLKIREGESSHVIIFFLQNCFNYPNYFTFPNHFKITLTLPIKYLLELLQKLQWMYGSTSVKEPVYQCRRHKRCRFDSWVRTIPGVWDGHLLQYSWLEKSIDRGAWWVTVHGITKNRRRLNTHTHTHKSIWRELTYFPIHDHNMPLHLFTSSGFLFLLIFSFHHVPCSSFNKESACSAEDLSSIPGLGRSPGEGNGNLLQYPCLENLMNRGAW